MLHELKYAGLDLCDAVYSGAKKYEIRKNDRNFQVNDIIKPIPVDRSGSAIDHPVANKRYKITYVTTEWQDALAEGYCVFSVEELRNYIPIEKKSFRWKMIAYVDSVDNMADSLFIARHIKVKFCDEYTRDGMDYKVVFCKVPIKQYAEALDALSALRDKLILCGRTGYDEAVTLISEILDK